MKKRIFLIALHLIVLGCFALCMIKFPEEIIELKASIRQKIVSVTTASRLKAVKEDDSFPVISPTGEEWYSTNRLIYHAGGGIDGLTYSNSKEALEQTLSRGNRVIEIDFLYTSDGHLVCAHDWHGITNQSSPPDLETYKNLRIYGKLTPLTAEELLDYMVQFNDLYIVLDTKESDAVQIVKDLIALCGDNSDLPHRFIIQLYGSGDKQKLMDIYPFTDENFLFTAYKFGTGDPIRIMELCYQENISVITVPHGSLVPEAIDFLTQKGFILFEHTVNHPNEACSALEKGVYGLYTDFLWPSDLTP